MIHLSSSSTIYRLMNRLISIIISINIIILFMNDFFLFDQHHLRFLLSNAQCKFPEKFLLFVCLFVHYKTINTSLSFDYQEAWILLFIDQSLRFDCHYYYNTIDIIDNDTIDCINRWILPKDYFDDGHKIYIKINKVFLFSVFTLFRSFD